MDETQTTPKKSNMGLYGIVGVVLLLGVGGFVLLSNQNRMQPTQTTQDQTAAPTTVVEQATPTTEPTVSQSASESGKASSTKTFTVSGKNFSFDVKEMRVKKGDTVKVVFTSGQGMHDFVIDEFDVRTKVVQTGESDGVEFVANKTGTFEYYCSIGQHRQNGMVGKLIVE